MDNKILFVVIFSGIWLFLGAVFLIIGLAVDSSRKKKEINCTLMTTGTVVGFEKVGSAKSTARYPVIEYCIRDNKYKKRYSFSGKTKYSVGQQVKLCCDPNKPNSFYIAGDSTPKLIAKVFSAVGASAIAVAVVVAVAVLVIA